MMNTLLDVSKKIKQVREQRNLSQERFGKKVGKTGKTISAYEHGRCHPPLRVLEEISQVYDVTFMSVKQSKAEDLSRKIQDLKDLLTDFEKIIKG